MVKFRVRESNPEPKETEIEFWLEKDMHGDINVMVSDGIDRGRIIGFFDVSDATFTRVRPGREIPGLVTEGGLIRVI